MARKDAFEQVEEVKAELDAIKAKLEQKRENAAKEMMKLLVRSGLTDLKINRDELLEEFKAIAARFRGKQEGKAANGNPANGADGTLGEEARNARS